MTTRCAMPGPAGRRPRSLVVGLGNPLRRDDALGLAVAAELAQRTGADVVGGPLCGLALLDHMAGYDRLIVVDSVRTGADAPGTVRRIDLGEAAPAEPGSGRHGLGIAAALQLGRTAGVAVPGRAVVYTMEAADLSGWGEGLSEPVARAVPDMVRRILCEQFRGQAGAGAGAGGIGHA
ncbi:MAG: hydrogenase maturation protease [Deltaproteobacteria bacterium]|nr:hydrogenase maturation protease [Deltaproteobacteria bacterium]